MADDEKPSARSMRKTAKKTVNFAKATIAMFDKDNDGYLSMEEMGKRFPPLSLAGISGFLNKIRVKELSGRVESAAAIEKGFNASRIDTTVVTDDIKLIDAEALTTTLSLGFGIGPERMAKLVHHAFPKGVADMKLSDMCVAKPELNCTPLPNHKVLLQTRPGIKV